MASRNSPIFIVGAPRSGTTLLATLLASYSRLSCGPETHFFPHLEANYPLLPALLQDWDWPRQATAFVASLTVAGHPLPQMFGVSPIDIHAFLQARPPTPQALLESLVVPHQIAQQKVRWEEKTPNHLLHLAPIRRLYPTARIIRIVSKGTPLQVNPDCLTPAPDRSRWEQLAIWLLRHLGHPAPLA